jgi:hypothetical protein
VSFPDMFGGFLRQNCHVGCVSHEGLFKIELTGEITGMFHKAHRLCAWRTSQSPGNLLK